MTEKKKTKKIDMYDFPVHLACKAGVFWGEIHELFSG